MPFSLACRPRCAPETSPRLGPQEPFPGSKPGGRNFDLLRLLLCAIFFALLVTSTNAEDQAAPGKNTPTDMAIIKSCGSDLATMFAKFGQPSDVVPARGDTVEMDRVLCDYDTFMFSFRDQKIRGAFFRNGWTGSIMGIKIGNTREAVVKVLGAAPETYKDKDGVITDYGYPMKDLGVEFYANFDAKTGKLIRVEIEPLE